MQVQVQLCFWRIWDSLALENLTTSWRLPTQGLMHGAGQTQPNTRLELHPLILFPRNPSE